MFRWLVDPKSTPPPPQCADNRVSFELLEEADSRPRRSSVDFSSRRGSLDVPARGASIDSQNRVPAMPAIAEADEYQMWREHYPSVLTNFQKLAAYLHGKRLAVFLDYDGTLTPIVSNPDMALMSTEMRDTVRALAQMFPTAIISGRGREKVENFVKLKELYYAGSHGMDIAGPKTADGNGGLCFQPAAEFASIMDTLFQQLTDRLSLIPGATVEHNKFCVTAHFRNCAVEHWQKVVRVVMDTIQKYKNLKVTKGRKVLEIRPQVDWDKGKALNHLMEALGLKSQPDVVAMYIGDDVTDEDAFRVLKENNNGVGILVSTKAKATHAGFSIRDPAEVNTFLRALVEWGKTPGNGWHGNGKCIGWSSGFVANGTHAELVN